MSLDNYFAVEKPEEKKEIIVKPTLSTVVFEPKAVYGGDTKKLYTFDESLRALRERGYERHPRPAEAFDLICRGLEGKVSAEEKAVVDDMLNSWGEWLSAVVLRKGNMLHFYLDPENLVWNDSKVRYVISGRKLKYSEEKAFSVVGLCKGYSSISEVHEANPLLVEFLWSRHYAILPEEIRQNAYLYRSFEGILGPVGRNDGRYDVYANYSNWASRGVQRNV